MIVLETSWAITLVTSPPCWHHQKEGKGKVVGVVQVMREEVKGREVERVGESEVVRRYVKGMSGMVKDEGVIGWVMIGWCVEERKVIW